MVLPQTDSEGATLLAERMRAAVERLEVPRVDGLGSLRLTGELRGGCAAGERRRPGGPDRGSRRRALPREARRAGTASSGPSRCRRTAERSDGQARDVPRASIGFRAMGVLDDAIREHLDLKRRHGVAEEELLRQEEEALGPARREVAPAADSDDGEPTGEAPPQPVDGHEPAELPVDEAVEESPAADTPPQGFERRCRRGAPARRGRARRRRGRAPGRGGAPRGRGASRRRRELRRGGRRPIRRGSRPARGHTGLPAGDAGARPALVRAEAAARLRLRLSASRWVRPPRRGRSTRPPHRRSCGEGRPPRRPPRLCNPAAPSAAF